MKKYILTIIGLFIVIALIAFNKKTTLYFNNNDKIIHNLNLLKQKELELNYEIFTISVYLYKNFDSIMEIEREILPILNELRNDKNFEKHKESYQLFLKYDKNIKKKIELIYETETMIAPLKNADMYIAELIPKLPELKMNVDNEKLFLNITSQIFLAKSSLDLTFIKNLNNNILQLEESSNIGVDNALIKNIELINKLFPKYVVQMREILHFKTEQELEECYVKFLKEASEKLKVITIVSILLILFVIISISLILYLFFNLEKENKKLEYISITDELTKLYNRRKLELDVKEMKKGVLFIVNIDRFKYYNDFYGIEAGDFILQKTAIYLKKIFPSSYKPNFYRIGADDFGILFEYSKEKEINSKDTAFHIIEYFKNSKIKYKEIEFHISISIGISYIKPLIETADIALKSLKKERKDNIGIYNPELGEKQKIEENIIKTTILKEAIEKRNIIPYFQPIFSNKTGEIIKYEVLARVVNGDRVMSIYPFLEIAKENKVYKYITQAIYSQAFSKFKDKKIEFSINISIEDINDEETMRFLKDCMKRYPNLFQYVTFEILEDDAIKSYNLLKEFIVFVKGYGSKIAIDDFGSGYSNFAHILNLDIDYLKIDGSLIKNLDTDKKMEIIVETIVNFAKKTDMEIIGEFVHSKEVLAKVKELNIDYSQGFYLGEPKADLV